MGTRADFYIGKGIDSKWLGSIAWDGFPENIDNNILTSDKEDVFCQRVETFLMNREDASKPEDGWPWPWSDSNTTDYTYTFGQ